MGFYDEFRRTLAERGMMGKNSPLRVVRDATVLRAQNVMDYYATEIVDQEQFRKQMGSLVPPWPVFWVETGRPTEKKYRVNQTVLDWPDFAFEQAGVLAQVWESPQDDPSVRWRILFTSFYKIPMVHSPATNEYFPYPYIKGEFDLNMEGETTDHQIRLEQPTGQFAQFVSEQLFGLIRWNQQIFSDVLLLSLSFCNCRNVALPETIPPARPLTKKEQKLPQHLQPRPERRFHTIVIQPFKPKIPQTGTPTGEVHRASPSLHIVKGGFHTYTQEKPLFGNPDLWGKFWIPQHTRGSAERGSVSADYEIDLTDATKQQGVTHE